MIDPNVKGFNPGGIKDRVDTRDFKWEEVGFGSIPFNWDEGYDVEKSIDTKLPVKDQGASFSCGGQAWSTYSGVLEAGVTGSLEERSAKFFYAQTYQIGGGSTGRDNANVFINEGSCRETVLSSYIDPHTPPTEVFITRGQDIGDTARNDARSDRGFSYAQTGVNIDSIAQAMRDNTGVVMGLDGQNNGTWLSAFPTPPTRTEWRHWVYAGKAKKINGVKHIGFLNSWGVHVGEGGWQWIPETYFTSGHIWSGWTHVLAPILAPSFHHDFVSDLSLGQSGGDIPSLQKALQIDGEFPKTVPATGYYGDITRRAVLDFQIKYMVAPLAELNALAGKTVGPKTRAKLNTLFN